MYVCSYAEIYVFAGTEAKRNLISDISIHRHVCMCVHIQKYVCMQMPEITEAKRKLIRNFNVDGLDATLQTFFKAYFSYVAKLDVTCATQHL